MKENKIKNLSKAFALKIVELYKYRLICKIIGIAH